MKKSIQILATVGILFLLSFSSHAQTEAQFHDYDWTGNWETTLLGNNWTINITRSGDRYTGTFPNGTLVGKYQYGDLIGTYTRTNVKMDKTGIKMCKTGKFRFVMHADEKAFSGYYKPEDKNDWQREDWNGKRADKRKSISKKQNNLK